MTTSMPYDDEEVSEFLIKASISGGSPHVECNCGVYHFCPDSDSLDDDERQSMLDDVESKPAKNKAYHGYDSIEYCEVDGRIFVPDGDCGCKKNLRRYEDWIWSHRDIIRRYLKERCEAEKQWAEHEVTLNLLANL